jgi:hypothetical protein
MENAGERIRGTPGIEYDERDTYLIQVQLMYQPVIWLAG